MYSLLTPQNIDHYFSFKHIPGCGKLFRPMNRVRCNDSFDDAKVKVREMLMESASHIAWNALESTCHILLSGGLDSCITLHTIRQHYDGKIISYTLDYTGTWEGKSTDLEYARELSKIYNTEHYEYAVTADEMKSNFNEIVRMLKYPFAGFVSPFFAAKMLPPDVPVLTGDLSDELFGSYKGPREVSGAGDDVLKWRMSLPGWIVFSQEEKERLYKKSFMALLERDASSKLAGRWYRDTGDRINDMLEFDWLSIAPDQVFYSPSKLMLWNEDVSPFMDANFIDYATSLPGEYKVKDGNIKYILKEAFRGFIPDFIIDRKKEGFVQPSNYWLYHDWKEWVMETMETAKDSDIFNYEEIQAIVSDYYAGKKENEYKVWAIFCYLKWQKLYGQYA